ncbi:MAG: type I pullulanase [Bacilli bacterium]
MKNNFVSAKLISLNRISLMIMTMNLEPIKRNVYLSIDNELPTILKVVKKTSTNNITIYELELDEPFHFGHRYDLYFENQSIIPLDVSEAPSFSEFDALFNYHGDDLGATYHKEFTEFVLWSPISFEVYLKLENNNGSFDLHKMIREDNGIYRIKVYGDLLNKKYHYVVVHYNGTKETNDPYGKGISLNSKYSAVVDISSIKKRKKVKPNTYLSSINEHIIYELNIRDFTSSKYTDIKEKGKYLGLVEKNRKNKDGFPAGLDYLKYIKVNTLQLQPIFDFRGVDDIDVEKSYNWGYDPISMFALEGSYSSNPSNPQSRLIEFKEMIDKLHAEDLYVTIDVVYNHTYDYLTSTFENIVPSYFFRKKSNGEVSSASGCGNDFASERYMARKAIIDSVKYLIDVFDVDGIRFDLMGLIDIKTIDNCLIEAKKIKENIIFYGEGWDMGYELKREEKAASINADKLKGVAFFNDSYREIIKGPTFGSDLKKKGFVGGDLSYRDGAIFALLGSSYDYCFPKRFLQPHQSINYVECHDNNTLFDKLSISNDDDDNDTLLKRINFANSVITISFGIPFYHMGQEIGLSKFGLDNTYNICKVNDMDYKLVSNRFEMINYFRSLNILRKEFKILQCDDMDLIYDLFKFEKNDDGTLTISLRNGKQYDDYKKLVIILNPTKNTLSSFLREYYKLYFYDGGFVDDQNVFVQNLILPPLSMTIIYKK